jgi:multiple sugar transport system substrate-binding protein
MLIRIISVVLAALLLAACFPADAGAPAPNPAAVSTAVPAPVTITWAFWGDPWEVEINERVVQIFENDHPGIKVETFHRPWQNYFTELRAKFNHGEPTPDVLFWAEAANDVPGGHFLDLTPLIESDNYPLTDFFPGLLTHFKVGGGLYGFPRDSDTKVIFYNKRLLNRADIPFPKAGWNWADLRRAALDIKAANVTNYSFAYEANDWWMVWMWQNNVDIFDDKLFPTQTHLNDPAAAQAVQFLADLTNVDGVTPPYEQLNSTDIAALFSAGQVAMVFGNHALIPAFADITDFEWDVAPLPRQKRQANVAAGAGYVIAANTPHPDAAWTFLKFLASPKGQAIFTESGVVVPARRSVAQSDIFMNQTPRHNAQAFLDGTEIGEPTYAFPGADEITGLINQALTPVWRGEQDAAGALNAILPEIKAILAKNRGNL